MSDPHPRVEDPAAPSRRWVSSNPRPALLQGMAWLYLDNDDTTLGEVHRLLVLRAEGPVLRWIPFETRNNRQLGAGLQNLDDAKQVVERHLTAPSP